MEIVKGTPKPDVEIEFARGTTLGTQRIRVAYKILNPNEEPDGKFPTIYKTEGDDSVTELSLTPAQGKFLAEVLSKMFPDK